MSTILPLQLDGSVYEYGDTLHIPPTRPRHASDNTNTTSIRHSYRIRPASDIVEGSLDRLGSIRSGNTVEFRVSSRDTRKGRHMVEIRSSAAAEPVLMFPGSADIVKSPSASFVFEMPPHKFAGKRFYGNLKDMMRVWRFRKDVSYLMAFVSVFGTMCWIINAVAWLLPTIKWTVNEHEMATAVFSSSPSSGGWIVATTEPAWYSTVRAFTSMIGASMFIGIAILGVLEVINVNRNPDLAFTLEHEWDEIQQKETIKMLPGESFAAQPVQAWKHESTLRRTGGDVEILSPIQEMSSRSPTSQSSMHRTIHDDKWPHMDSNVVAVRTKGRLWVPSWQDIKTHYMHQIAFHAALVTLLAALIMYPGNVINLTKLSRPKALKPFYERL